MSHRLASFQSDGFTLQNVYVYEDVVTFYLDRMGWQGDGGWRVQNGSRGDVEAGAVAGACDLFAF